MALVEQITALAQRCGEVCKSLKEATISAGNLSQAAANAAATALQAASAAQAADSQFEETLAGLQSEVINLTDRVLAMELIVAENQRQLANYQNTLISVATWAAMRGCKFTEPNEEEGA